MEHAKPLLLAETQGPRPSGTAVPPRLAIVIACYNYADFVGRAIESVLAQGRDDIELIVIDDGSADASWDAIGGYGVAACRIENSGARRACLFGFDRTTAPFVLFLDADDELRPGSIATLVEHLDPGIAKLQMSMERIDAEGRPIDDTPATMDPFRSREDLARRVLRTGVYRSPPTSGNVFRRDLCEFLREADYDPFVDGVMLFAAPFVGDVVSLPDVLARYRIHTRNDSGLGRAPQAQIFQRDMDRFAQRLDHLRRILVPLGRGGELIDPRRTFYYRERQFCLAIAAGRRPSARTLVQLLSKLGGEAYSTKNRIAVAVFLLLAFASGNKAAQSLMTYRFKAGSRSATGLLKAAFAGRDSDTQPA